MAAKKRALDLRQAENFLSIEKARAVQDAAEKIKTAQKMTDVTTARMRVLLLNVSN